MKSRAYAAAFRFFVWLATEGGAKIMSESLKRRFATNAAILIMAGRITIDDVSPLFRDLTLVILGEMEPKEGAETATEEQPAAV